jgi:hypothetical protein
MITKILLTLLVIIAALIFIRHQHGAGSGRGGPGREAERQLAADRRRAMVIAIALVLLTLLVSAAIYYAHWQQEHRLFRVQVTNSHSGVVQSYTVYRREINGRSFRTTDGREIHLADSERMEVQESPAQ